VLYNLHLLRVIAALGVVYFHTTSTSGLKLSWDVGSRGVDIFFVISGFIIAFIGSAKQKQFFRRRLIRVVPFYWAATLVVFAVVTVKPEVFHTATNSVKHLFYSLAFLPHPDPHGELEPTLTLGWSLNYEMFFYVVFALSLLVAHKRAPIVSVLVIVAVVVALYLSGNKSVAAQFYGRPIVLEFCYGIIAFYLFRAITAHKDALAGNIALKGLLLVLAIGSLVFIAVGEHYWGDVVPRQWIAGIPSFVLVLSALLLEKLFGLFSSNKTIFELGEASYIIYLIHPYIVFTVLRVFAKNAEHWSAPPQALLILALLALTSGLAWLIHTYFEKPVMGFLRAKLT
jgi:peptidoglycan/LPS O-acetylase OafA/YrhL